MNHARFTSLLASAIFFSTLSFGNDEHEQGVLLQFENANRRTAQVLLRPETGAYAWLKYCATAPFSWVGHALSLPWSLSGDASATGPIVHDPKQVLETLRSWSLRAYTHPLSGLEECSTCLISRVRDPAPRQIAEDKTVALASTHFSHSGTLKVISFADQALFQTLVLTQKLVNTGHWGVIELHVIDPYFACVLSGRQTIMEMDDKEEVQFRLHHRARLFSRLHTFMTWFSNQNNANVKLFVYPKANDYLVSELERKRAGAHQPAQLLVSMDWKDDISISNNAPAHRLALMLTLAPAAFSVSLMSYCVWTDLHITRRSFVRSPFADSTLDKGSDLNQFLTRMIRREQAEERVSDALEEADNNVLQMVLGEREHVFTTDRRLQVEFPPAVHHEDDLGDADRLTIDNIMREIHRANGVIDPIWLSSFPTRIVAVLLAWGVHKQHRGLFP